MKHTGSVADHMVVGPHGQPVLESGYREIRCKDGALRIYRDRLVIGPGGLPRIEKGRTEIVANETPRHDRFR